MAKMYGLMRLGRDAELRTTPNGKQVCNLALAYNYGRRDDSGETPSQWIDASIWGERAEALAPYLLKGSMHLFTIGDVHIETFTDRDGNERPKLVGIVSDVELGPKRESGTQQQAAAPRPAQRPTPAPRQAPTPAPAPRQGGSSGFDDMDPDIPF